MSNGRYWFVSTATLHTKLESDFDRLAKWYASERLERHFMAPGCTQAWLLSRVKHEDSFGRKFADVTAVYEVTDPRRFGAGAFDPDWEWGPFAVELKDTRRLTRRLLASFDFSDRPGTCWATVRINFQVTSMRDRQQEIEFNHWYTHKHMPEVCGNEGFHRAWRLGRVGVPQSVPFDEDYWAIYELDDPADLMKPVYQGPFWDGIWGDNIAPDSLARSYHTLIDHYVKS